MSANNSGNKQKGCGCVSFLMVLLLIGGIKACAENRESEKAYSEEYQYSEEYDYSESYGDPVNMESLPVVIPEADQYDQSSAPQTQVSNGSTLDDDRIKEDIYANNSEMRNAGLSVRSFEITNKESDQSAQMETIWITYTAENDACVYYGEILFVYQYYNEMWNLETVEHGSNYYEAKYGCDQNIPYSYVEDVYAGANASVTIMEAYKPDVNREEFEIFATWQENEVIMNTDSHYVICEFDLYEGWRVVDSTQSRYKETWDIYGRYTCSNDKLSAVVDITDFVIDSQNNTYTLTYSYSFTSYVSNDDLYGGAL